MTNIILKCVVVVGAHYNGCRELPIGRGFKVEPDFSNIHTPNAISVHDNLTGRKKAYLSRKSAAQLAFLFREYLIKGKLGMLIKHKELAEIRK